MVNQTARAVCRQINSAAPKLPPWKRSQSQREKKALRTAFSPETKRQLASGTAGSAQPVVSEDREEGRCLTATKAVNTH